MCKKYPENSHLPVAHDYLEWVVSEDGMAKVRCVLRSHSATRHVDPVVFVQFRVDAIRRRGIIPTSIKLRQLFELAGPHGRMDEGMMGAIEKRRYPV